MAETLQIHTVQNGNAWYWEVVAWDHKIVARGLADTHAEAIADAEIAASQFKPALQM